MAQIVKSLKSLPKEVEDLILEYHKDFYWIYKGHYKHLKANKEFIVYNYMKDEKDLKEKNFNKEDSYLILCEKLSLWLNQDNKENIAPYNISYLESNSKLFNEIITKHITRKPFNGSIVHYREYDYTEIMQIGNKIFKVKRQLEWL